MAQDLQNLDDFLKKVENFKNKEVDLSSDEDLSIALMNLISIEEHFFFTAEKTGKNNYFDLLNEVRQIRKELMKMIVKEPEGEEWCISKHLLASSMRLIEVGTKKLQDNQKDLAYELFEKAFTLYNIFWAINLKVVEIGKVKKIDEEALNTEDQDKTLSKKLSEIVKKLIDCCKE
ncbi:MAG TPA: hypothetical protein P5225_01835 [Candidatus Paceibacterota bacterium]|jgi:hypothetical protein|nr:hypothetical protein [Candidatus Paceibacterota bacterium]